jgi:hypothetical protein
MLERARIEPHETQPGKAQLETKYRVYRPIIRRMALIGPDPIFLVEFEACHLRPKFDSIGGRPLNTANLPQFERRAGVEASATL